MVWSVGAGVVWADAIYNPDGYSAPGSYLRSFMAGPFWPVLVPLALARARKRRVRAKVNVDISAKSLDEILRHIDGHAADDPEDPVDNEWMAD